MKTALMKLLAPAFAGALLLAPSVASAASPALTYWAYGNGDTMVSIWRMIREMTTGAGWWALVMSLCLIGFVISTTASAVRMQAPEKALFYFFALSLFISVTAHSKVNIMVEDPISPSFSPQAVEDVPVLIGLPVTFISNIGLRLTEAIENTYIHSFPGNYHDSGAVSKTGRFNLYGQLMKDSLEIAIVNPYLKASMRNYVADCAVPLLYKGTIKINEVLSDPEIWKALKTTQATLLTTYMSQSEVTDPVTGQPTHELLSDCPTAWSAIASDITADAPNLVAALGSKLGYQTNLSNTEATSFMGLALADAINTTSNGLLTNNAAGWVERTAAINTFADIGDSVLSGDTGGLAQAMSLQQAKAAQKSGWMFAADIFQATMGYVYVVLQTFVIAVSPVLLLLAVIPGFGGKALVGWLKLNVWLALWPIMLAIVNFIIMSFLRQGLGAQYFGNTGPNLASIGATTHQAQMLVAAASFVGTSVPMIAWAIVSGLNYAFTEFVGSGSGAKEAQSAANNTVADNIKFREQKYDNVSAHAHSTTHSFTDGVQTPVVHSAGGASRVRNFGQTANVINGTNVNPTGNVGSGFAGADASSNVTNAGSTTTNTTAAQHMTQWGVGQSIGDSLKQDISVTAAGATARDGSRTDQTAKQLALKEAATSGVAGRENQVYTEGAQFAFNPFRPIAKAAQTLSDVVDNPSSKSATAEAAAASAANAPGLRDSVLKQNGGKELSDKQMGELIHDLSVKDPKAAAALFDSGMAAELAKLNGTTLNVKGGPPLTFTSSAEQNAKVLADAYRKDPAHFESAAQGNPKLSGALKQIGAKAGKFGAGGIQTALAVISAFDYNYTNQRQSQTTSGLDSGLTRGTEGGSSTSEAVAVRDSATLRNERAEAAARGRVLQDTVTAVDNYARNHFIATADQAGNSGATGRTVTQTATAAITQNQPMAPSVARQVAAQVGAGPIAATPAEFAGLNVRAQGELRGERETLDQQTLDRASGIASKADTDRKPIESASQQKPDTTTVAATARHLPSNPSTKLEQPNPANIAPYQQQVDADARSVKEGSVARTLTTSSGLLRQMDESVSGQHDRAAEAGSNALTSVKQGVASRITAPLQVGNLAANIATGKVDTATGAAKEAWDIIKGGELSVVGGLLGGAGAGAIKLNALATDALLGEQFKNGEQATVMKAVLDDMRSHTQGLTTASGSPVIISGVATLANGNHVAVAAIPTTDKEGTAVLGYGLMVGGGRYVPIGGVDEHGQRLTATEVASLDSATYVGRLDQATSRVTINGQEWSGQVSDGAPRSNIDFNAAPGTTRPETAGQVSRDQGGDGGPPAINIGGIVNSALPAGAAPVRDGTGSPAVPNLPTQPGSSTIDPLDLARNTTTSVAPPLIAPPAANNGYGRPKALASSEGTVPAQDALAVRQDRIDRSTEMTVAAYQAEGGGRFDEYFQKAGRDLGVDWRVLKLIGAHESGLNADAINENANGTTDRGVMQLNSRYFNEDAATYYKITDTKALEAQANIAAGSAHFANLLDQEGGDIRAAFARYNGTGQRADDYATVSMAAMERLGLSEPTPLRAAS